MALTSLDAQRAHEAQVLGQRHRGWLVLWAVWHRSFTAFSCFASAPLVVEAATADELTLLLRQAELHHAVASTVRMAGAVQPPAAHRTEQRPSV